MPLLEPLMYHGLAALRGFQKSNCFPITLSTFLRNNIYDECHHIAPDGDYSRFWVIYDISKRMVISPSRSVTEVTMDPLQAKAMRPCAWLIPAVEVHSKLSTAPIAGPDHTDFTTSHLRTMCNQNKLRSNIYSSYTLLWPQRTAMFHIINAFLARLR